VTKRKKIQTKLGGSGLSLVALCQSKFSGGIQRGIELLHRSHPMYCKAFNLRVSEIRIDYVQHAFKCNLFIW